MPEILPCIFTSELKDLLGFTGKLAFFRYYQNVLQLFILYFSCSSPPSQLQESFMTAYLFILLFPRKSGLEFSPESTCDTIPCKQMEKIPLWSTQTQPQNIVHGTAENNDFLLHTMDRLLGVSGWATFWRTKNSLIVIVEALTARLQNGKTRLLLLPILRREQQEKEFSSLKAEKCLTWNLKGQRQISYFSQVAEVSTLCPDNSK